MRPVHLAYAGTLIDQGEAPEFYFQKFPEDNPLLGFFTWRWILTLGFDHMFSSPVFLGTLALLGTSLMACTYTRQIPLVKVARRYSFIPKNFCHLFSVWSSSRKQLLTNSEQENKQKICADTLCSFTHITISHFIGNKRDN